MADSMSFETLLAEPLEGAGAAVVSTTKTTLTTKKPLT